MTPETEHGLQRSVAWWRALAIGAGVLLLAAVSYGFWAIMDQGVTIAYKTESIEGFQRMGGLLERVALRITPSTTRSQLLSIVREIDSLAFEKDGAVHADGVSFYFAESGTLACISAFVEACEAFEPPSTR